MRLSLDALPDLKRQAEETINAHFNALAGAHAQRDAEHAAKRQAARDVLQDNRVEWFDEAARIEGVDPLPFAIGILAKPDEAAARGIRRRRLILATRAATTPAEIDTILLELNQ